MSLTSYVVDASVVAHHLIKDTFTANADALFALIEKEVSLYVPEFCAIECTNVLWKQVHFHSMPQGEAEILAQQLAALPLNYAPIDAELLTRALQIGVANKLAIYDSIYIALAEKYAYPLITADAKQETAARTTGVIIKLITDF
jgi:predicted nucleic acid-binding protein